MEVLAIVLYWALLKYEVLSFMWSIICGVIMAQFAIQNIYILHDVVHGATFAPYDWQTYITHPFADFFSCPWMDIIMEHNRHHNSTFDLLNHNEFGWDKANWLYYLQEWTFEWYGWLGAPGVFEALRWSKRHRQPVRHPLVVELPGRRPGRQVRQGVLQQVVAGVHQAQRVRALLLVWLLGSIGMGKPFSDGWKFTLLVSAFYRIGFSLAWSFIANVNHSHLWNEFLATDLERTWPWLHDLMAFALGGRHRWNEMFFHDVHGASVEILANGLWKSDDAETKMDQNAKKRSLVLKS